MEPPVPVNSFLDIDQPATFLQQLNALKAPETRNFALNFDADEASCKANLLPEDLLSLIASKKPDSTQVSWLNFWSWDSSYNEVFETIAKRYTISPRLVGLIWPKIPQAPAKVPTDIKTPNTDDSSSSSSTEKQHHHHQDLEKAFHLRHRHHQPLAAPAKPPKASMGFNDIVNNLWHFCSNDSGAHYLHIGFNQLFIVPGQPRQSNGDKPAGIRIWTSILLCDDGTVISVSEPPPPELRSNLDLVKVVRGNILNIYTHLSRLHDSAVANPLHKVSIRPPPLDRSDAAVQTQEQKETACHNTSSLLFYYLFDDWYTSFKLLARLEHPYRDTIEEIRGHMFTSADIDLVHSIHQVGRQLGVLKLMYQSYELIVSRILHSQRIKGPPSPDDRIGAQTTQRRINSFESHLNMGNDHDDDDDTERSLVNASHSFDNEAGDGSNTGPQRGRRAHGSRVRLSTSSLVRFERLLDRIRLYALTEIDSCLREKEELVLMNFNLVALRESHTVEKLTRTTILLAKVTVLFLPVSLMTAYFSLSIGNIGEVYNLATYWYSFLVVGSLTILFLMGFGLIGWRVEKRGGGYVSGVRMLWNKAKGKSVDGDDIAEKNK